MFWFELSLAPFIFILTVTGITVTSYRFQDFMKIPWDYILYFRNNLLEQWKIRKPSQNTSSGVWTSDFPVSLGSFQIAFLYTFHFFILRFLVNSCLVVPVHSWIGWITIKINYWPTFLAMSPGILGHVYNLICKNSQCP